MKEVEMGRLPGELLHAAAKIFATYERNLIREKTGRGTSDFNVLASLSVEDNLTATELGRKLLLTSGSVTTAIDRVERRGLVERRVDPGDRRAVRVRLTESGRQLLQTSLPEVVSGLEAAFSGLHLAERAQLANLLRKLISGLPRGPFDGADLVGDGAGALRVEGR